MSGDAPDNKVSLLDMILHAEQEIGDIDVWERVLNAEGSDLYQGMARRRELMRRIAATLELIRLHEREFVAMVRAARESARRQQRAAGAAPRSTAPSSPPSTSASAGSDPTEP